MEKQKNIPALRFPEFGGEWEGKRLGEIGEIYQPRTISQTDLTESGFDVYGANGIIGKYSKFNHENSQIAVTCRGNTCGTINFTNPKSWITGNAMVVNLDAATTVSKKFIFYQLVNTNFSYLITGSGQPQITGEIKKHFLKLPSFFEQKKIATFLAAIDEKLQALKKKKALLEQYKKGVMQKIFSQELRFKDENGNDFADWKEEKLGKISKITTGKLDANAMVKDGEYRFYTCAKDYFKIDKWAFDTEALLVSGNGANVGYIHYYKGKFNAYQRTYVMDGFSDEIVYVKYFLDHFLSQRIDGEKKEGNTPYIVMSTLSEMNLNLPTLPEQQKIANFLTTIDEKINQQQSQIEKVSHYKKGLLQQMFC
jgi:type I restriction enzyme S subunit